MTQHDALFSAGKARWLLQHADQLTPDQQALLLAIANLEVQAGRELSAEERAALDALATRLDGYDADEISAAMKHVVEARPTRKVVDWPKDLGRRLHDKKG